MLVCCPFCTQWPKEKSVFWLRLFSTCRSFKIHFGQNRTILEMSLKFVMLFEIMSVTIIFIVKSRKCISLLGSNSVKLETSFFLLSRHLENRV